jgi:[protein-PII] uridylyltransferase
MISPGSVPELTELYATESARIREQFEATRDGRGAGLARAVLVDTLIARLYGELLSHDLGGPKGFCLVALGGYGRRELFPQSDIDLLFLSESTQTETCQRDALAALARTLWDLRLRVGQTTRRLAECAQLHRQNLEFNLSLLDCRYLAGDPWLFARLRHDAVPQVAARDRQDLVRGLAEITRHRHERHGNTVFHLEPNLKEAPGGLRDYNVSRWLTLISELEQQGRWVNAEEYWPSPLGAAATQALEFLSAVRCFLHYRQGRDDNLLSYEYQDQAAALGIGHQPSQAMLTAEWMRSYFRHARAIHRLTARLLNDIPPARSSLYALFQDWRSRGSNADFAVVRGRIFPRQPAVVDDPNLLLGLFEMVARQGLELSREAERWVEECLRGAGTKAANLPGLWQRFGHILVLPNAVEALRAMHRLGLLGTLFPELQAIDCLVFRDFYHRYTVDEHTFMAMESLQALGPAGRGPTAGQPRVSLEVWGQKFSEICAELERPELLLFSLLFHDVGKGRPASDHVAASLEAVEAILERLAADPEERETIQFLVSNHLEMSATLLRRDIFDPETIRLLAEMVGTNERLKMLTLLTYADVRGVNPEALTPWKAEALWELHVATSNYLARNLDRERMHGAQEATAKVERARRMVSTAGGVEEFDAFLEGFPRRYLLTHSAEEIATHYGMARQLPQSRAEAALRRGEHYFELTVLTADRPFLFASLTGTLTAWGMNIVKADAFANAAGTVLDTFRFVDLYRTLELNPSECERFKQSILDVLTGKVSLKALMRGRLNPRRFPRPKVTVPTQVRFDDVSSSQSTLLELVTQDRPGLLYRVSSALAELGCNIEVALIDTEGQKVIDVFYLTWQGKKLTPQKQTQLRKALLKALEALQATGVALPGPQ